MQGLTGSVTSAVLRIHANSASTAGYQIRAVSDNTWSEGGINYNNAPAMGNLLGAMGSFTAGSWTSVDVTTHITGNGLYSFALATNSNTAINFGSHEESANSPQASASPVAPVTVPAAPTGLSAISEDARVTLNWVASTGATSYIVRRSLTNGGSYTQVATTMTPTYVDAAVSNGSSYYYVVAAANAVGTSGNSSQATGSPVAAGTLPNVSCDNLGAAGVWTRDISKAHRVAAALKAGTVWINCYNIFDAALPFGGYKQSGWGREMGHEVLEHYTETKAVVVGL